MEPAKAMSELLRISLLQFDLLNGNTRPLRCHQFSPRVSSSTLATIYKQACRFNFLPIPFKHGFWLILLLGIHLLNLNPKMAASEGTVIMEKTPCMRGTLHKPSPYPSEETLAFLPATN
jgi:hypothetical protein